MLCLIFMEYIALPERPDAILSQAIANKEKLNIFSSGSIGLFSGGKCRQTFPNQTITDNKREDWCSNVVEADEQTIVSETEKPWISYHLPNKAIKLTGYAVRNGCCWETCCCLDDSTFIDNKYCCCRLYSFSLLGSNDNRTWVTLHTVEKDQKFRICEAKTYDLPDNSRSFRFIRFRMDQQWPGCPFCMQINQFELYGETIHSLYTDDLDNEEFEEESVSIIGKVRKVE